MPEYLKSFPAVDAGNNVTRQVLSENEAMMVVAFTFAEGGVGALHSHPHIQATYVKSGRFAFTIEGEEFEVGPGDSFVIPSNAEHGCKALEPGVLIDSFTPRRDDFL
ncbi:cupin domain-containing protein [Nitratireductor basaltis]|uniref:Cupin n=1 Tax=Nitratireductor basaltis TaxID=472175 RepID=A0A084U5A1_9HYPH|nr:cupin domain-containing protein [Nitratireductor basaltis]KFB08137.1 Cupin [Nitratireductor basaltis]